MLDLLDMALLITVGLALLVRLVTLPVLARAQTATRRRALAATGADATGGAPGGLGATFGELAAGPVAALAAYFAVHGEDLHSYYLLERPFDLNNSVYLGHEWRISVAVARTWYLALFIGFLLLWLLLWYLTQRKLLTTGLPREVWTSGSTRARLIALVLLRAVIGVFLLPVGVIFTALVFQVTALLVSRHPKPVGPEGSGTPEADAARAAQARQASQNPYAPTVPPHTPYTPQTPQPAYVPTQFTPPAAQPPTAPPVPSSPPRGTPLGAHEPRTIGGYQLLGRIGSGGMGTVYLAQRQGSATQVALKTINLELLHDADLLRRFQRESEVLAMVPGAYTARVLDTGVDSGRPYLAMELLDGRPLDVHLREQGPIRSAEALRALALALAVALSGVHRLGLVHRDLKPANIMLTTAGPRLLDFGIAAIVDGTRLTATGGGPGTLTYMAPEQFGEERVGPAADVWAWACCVVCAAHGASPFAATNTGAVIRRIVETGPEPAALAAVRDLDPAFAAVVTRALAIDPAQRPADGTGLLAALAAARSTPPDPAAVHDQITRGWQTLAL
ncbi:serine/threonine-protein kinase [Kitasatospora sp. NPDC101157]|uniref:serine/threonine-protein kinase n=1 Tax=Kitasatospora sp. NPDC101157 TaxID=3364098 RepID=UPI00382956EB